MKDFEMFRGDSSNTVVVTPTPFHESNSDNKSIGPTASNHSSGSVFPLQGLKKKKDNHFHLWTPGTPETLLLQRRAACQLFSGVPLDNS